MSKLSNTSINRYLTCPRSYKLRYVDNLVTESKGSPLFFGSALDDALNVLLKPKDGDPSAEEVFLTKWNKQADNQYILVDLMENENINFSQSDFDADLLQKEDWAVAYRRIKELGLDESLGPIKIRDIILNRKKQLGWEELTLSEKKYYNLLAWLSLKRKGLILIAAYKEKVLPRIKEVIDVQKYVTLDNGTGDTIRGYVDLIVRWEDDSIVVLDNKTSSMKYEEDSVINSQQLALYKLILNDLSTKADSGWSHQINKAGYVVLRKNIKKDVTKVCKSCGFTAKTNASHAKCYNVIDGQRCNGDWEKSVKFDVEVQFIVNEIPDENLDKVLETVNQVNIGIANSQFEPNYEACRGKYGLCDYYNLCHNNTHKGLINTKADK